MIIILSIKIKLTLELYKNKSLYNINSLISILNSLVYSNKDNN